MTLLVKISGLFVLMSLYMLLRALGRFVVDLLRYYGHATLEDGELRVDLRALSEELNIGRESWQLTLLQRSMGFSDCEFELFRAVLFGTPVGSSTMGASARQLPGAGYSEQSVPLSPRSLALLPKRNVYLTTDASFVDAERNGGDKVGITADELCPICIVDYEEDEEVKTLPCGHFFHSQCIDGWLGRQSNCPVCKYELKGQPCAAERTTSWNAFAVAPENRQSAPFVRQMAAGL
mmetsp:Transcript_6087/g.18401  ORF Transcript_6087/g.18401 Transcript_6087/m.18401 type:complete len:235 (-) Transcript_6087:65-769(-)